MVKCLPMIQETWVRFLDGEDPLEKAMATRSSTLARKIPWMEEPGGLQSMGLQRVRHVWATYLSFLYNFPFSWLLVKEFSLWHEKDLELLFALYLNFLLLLHPLVLDSLYSEFLKIKTRHPLKKPRNNILHKAMVHMFWLNMFFFSLLDCKIGTKCFKRVGKKFHLFLRFGGTCNGESYLTGT